MRARLKLPNLSDGTINCESSSTSNAESEARKDVKAVASSPSQSPGNTDSSRYGTLSKVPREVRDMIYGHVLEHKGYIIQPHRCLGRRLPILATEARHFTTIDAAILRTCKAIYHETINILYCNNWFVFSEPFHIREFAHTGLGATPFGFYDTIDRPSDAVTHAPYGRLTSIRHIILSLQFETSRHYTDELWSFWSDFFYPPEKQDQLVGFPGLQQLTLDLTDWHLDGGDESELRVCPVARISSHHQRPPVCLDARPFLLGFGRQKWHSMPAL